MPNIIYQCSKCRRQFLQLEEAEKCEHSHADIIGTFAIYEVGQQDPSVIRVKFANGRTKVYTAFPEVANDQNQTISDWWRRENIEIRGRII